MTFDSKNMAEIIDECEKISYDELSELSKVLSCINLENYTKNYPFLFEPEEQTFLSKMNLLKEIYEEKELKRFYKNLCNCVFHYILKKYNQHNQNQICVYENLMDSIDKIGFNDFLAYLKLLINLNSHDTFMIQISKLQTEKQINFFVCTFMYLFIEVPLIEKFKMTILNTIDEPERKCLFFFNDEEINFLLINLTILIIHLLYSYYEIPEVFNKYFFFFDVLLEKLFKNINLSVILYGSLKLHNFLIRQYLINNLAFGSNSVKLEEFNFRSEEDISFSELPLANIEKDIVFNSCYPKILKIIKNNIEKINKEKNFFKNLPQFNIEKIVELQLESEELINIGFYIKNFFNNLDFKLEKIEIKLIKPNIDLEKSFFLEYTYSQQPGYLFLTYCFIETHDEEKFKNYYEKLNNQIFFHPKIYGSLARKAILMKEKNKESFCAEILSNFMHRIYNSELLTKFITAHIESYGLNKLKEINIDTLKILSNSVCNNKCIIFQKYICLDPLECYIFMINYYCLKNKNLGTIISKLIVNEFRPISDLKITKGNYISNLITYSINFNLQKFDLKQLFELISFLKKVIAYDKKYSYSLIDYKHLLFLIIEKENFGEESSIVKKLLFFNFFIKTLDSINYEMKFKENELPIVIMYHLQLIDYFWQKPEQKMMVVTMLNYFIKKLKLIFSEKEKSWLLAKSKLILSKLKVLFYVKDLFSDKLINLIHEKNIIFIHTIDQDYVSEVDPRKKKNQFQLEDFQDYFCKNYLHMTIYEQESLFKLSIEYFQLYFTVKYYLDEGIRLQTTYHFDLVRHLFRSIVFQKYKKILIQECDLKEELKKIFSYLNDNKSLILEFCDELKFNNFQIELSKFSL